MVTDAHLHMRKDREEAMLTHLDSLSIDRALLMALNEKESEDNLLLASRHKDRLFAAVSPLETETGDLDLFLSRAREKGAAAVGELVVNKRIDSSYVSRIFALAQELRLPVTFHLSPEEGFSYGIVDDIHLPLLEKALRAFPSLVFVGHSQCFWIEIADDVPLSAEGRCSWGSGPVRKKGRLFDLMDDYPNLYCDLSANSAGCAIMRDYENGIGFLKRYAPRLFFGTDMTNETEVFPLRSYLEKLHEDGILSSCELNAIMNDNFERVFLQR